MKYIINNIYDKIHVCYNNIDKLIINKTINNVSLKNEIFKNEFFFPNTIIKWIKNNIHTEINYKFNINNLLINLNFYTNNINIITKEHIIKVLTLFNFFNYYYDNNCFQNLYIDIYLTPFKKFLPKNNNDDIYPFNINSGFSSHGCYKNKRIVIFRDEEWFKVLIHEVIHTYNLDFSINNNYELKNQLKNFYKIDSIYDINETYTESWARILNIIFYCFFEERKENSKIKNKNRFFILLNKIIIIEQKFYFDQIKKIVNIVYDSEYKEITNMFCYYILTYCIMKNYKIFLKWCYNNNKNLINFTKTKKNINLFIELLENNYNNMNIVNNIKKDKYYLMNNIDNKDNNIKMTLI